MLKIRTHNPETNEIIDRNMNEQELLKYNNAKKEDDLLKIKIEQEKTKKASGKQKLLDLGLSEEEVKALIGI
tara:strand:- start:72 stop:287 length:216 start_codon:yes stop_codon:yes gene_type:complete